MNILDIIKKTPLIKHLFIQISIFIFLLILLYFWLKFYTFHNESIEIPNLVGLSLEEAQNIAESHHLKIVLSDSVHFMDKPKGSIISQTPVAKSKVKPERTIYVIINGYENEKIPMPDLTGITVRQATADAELYGLRIGKLTYVPDISTTVLQQLYKGKNIAPNTLIPKGSVIDLVVGKGESNEKTNIICVVGKQLEEARAMLSSVSLNIGTIITDGTIKSLNDTTKAYIWKQVPTCSSNQPLPLGSTVDVWLTLDKDLISTDNNEIDF